MNDEPFDNQFRIFVSVLAEVDLALIDTPDHPTARECLEYWVEQARKELGK